MRYDPALEERGSGYITKEMQIRKAIRAFDDEATFLTPAGSGGAASITYLEGWDGSLFAQDWSGEGLFPVVVPKEVYDQSISGPDGLVGLVCKSFRMCQVAGYYTGSVDGESGETDPVLLPLSAYQSMCGSRMATYGKIHVTLDPALNRELEQFQSLLASAAANAREKAQVLCRASGVELGKLIRIDYSWDELNLVSPTRYELADCAMPLMAAGKRCAPEIQPDDIDLHDTAAFVWELEG